MERDYDICLCENCIEAILSRGERLFKGREIDFGFEEEPTKCEWCDEEYDVLYECIFG